MGFVEGSRPCSPEQSLSTSGANPRAGLGLEHHHHSRVFSDHFNSLLDTKKSLLRSLHSTIFWHFQESVCCRHLSVLVWRGKEESWHLSREYKGKTDGTVLHFGITQSDLVQTNKRLSSSKFLNHLWGWRMTPSPTEPETEDHQEQVSAGAFCQWEQHSNS